MTTTAQRPVTPPDPRGKRPLLIRAAAVGCSTLLAVTALTGPAAATGTAATGTATESPSPDGSPSTSPTPTAVANQAPQLTCGGVMTQAGSTESLRVSVTDPDGDPVTLSAGVSMFGVQPSVSGHVVTYPAPSSTTGQDNFVVLASDGQGGEAHCEIGVLVQPGATSPTPTPTPTPTTPTTPAPSTPAPEPSTDAPTPAPQPQPTSETPVPGDPPTPTPTSPPASPAPTTAPVTPGGGSDDETVTSPGTAAPAPGTGGDEGSDAGTPGGAAGTSGGGGGTSDGVDADGPGTGPDATEDPDGGSAMVLPPRPVPEAGAGALWAGVIPMELGAGSMRTLANARELLEGIDSGQVTRGGGDSEAGAPDAAAPDTAPTGAGEDRDAEAGAVPVDRTAAAGSSAWLFGVVGALMIALVGLALMALPRGRRRH